VATVNRAVPRRKAKEAVEAPGAWPVLGHVVPVLRRPLEFLPALARYSDVVKLRFGTFPVYVIADPDAVRDVLVPGDLDYRRGLCFERLEPGLGKGIATSPGRSSPASCTSSGCP
jgi:hypothetical protein